MTTRRSTKPSRPWPASQEGYLIAADAGLGSVPLEVRVTRRWREMDSNFWFLPGRRRADSEHFLKDACGEAARLGVEPLHYTAGLAVNQHEAGPHLG